MGTPVRFLGRPHEDIDEMPTDHIDERGDTAPFNIIQPRSRQCETFTREIADREAKSATCYSRLSAWRSPRPNSSSFRKPPKMRSSTNSRPEPSFFIVTFPFVMFLISLLKCR